MTLIVNMTFQADLVMYVNTDLQPHTALTHIQYDEEERIHA